MEVDLILARLHELHDIGVRLALDDFGTGHSSLARLDDLPVDIIKIPKPFTDRLTLDTRDTSLIGGLLQLARAMSLTSVVEGIENEGQVSRLLALDCVLGQGFLFQRPILDSGLDRYLESAIRVDRSAA
jgi:EAL domain-containing protein (putative c-di-GMP-specific phosphodiesterase class I)